MTQRAEKTLLGADDPPPVRTTNSAGRSMFLLVGDHAGDGIPARLDGLGLEDVDRRRHIAVDIGIARLGRSLARKLDAVFIEQRYSRLVIDCNRSPRSADSIPATSDGTEVPGNGDLGAAMRSQRRSEIFEPYHQAIGDALERRAALGIKTVLVALHSFTPSLNGDVRPWEIGILHDDGDARFARAMLLALCRDELQPVGDNQPYRMDSTDYTVPYHAYSRGLPYVEIEVRQDKLSSNPLIERVANVLHRALSEAAAKYEN